MTYVGAVPVASSSLSATLWSMFGAQVIDEVRHNHSATAELATHSTAPLHATPTPAEHGIAARHLAAWRRRPRAEVCVCERESAHPSSTMPARPGSHAAWAWGVGVARGGMRI